MKNKTWLTIGIIVLALLILAIVVPFPSRIDYSSVGLFQPNDDTESLIKQVEINIYGTFYRSVIGYKKISATLNMKGEAEGNNGSYHFIGGVQQIGEILCATIYRYNIQQNKYNFAQAYLTENFDAAVVVDQNADVYITPAQNEAETEKVLETFQKYILFN
ncbi:MAG: hypothetical protein LBU58_01450 [Clostridiales bacterium]|jgi:hypothetical protein|nr:hypothetical protein [Clostridiales bacterium]